MSISDDKIQATLDRINVKRKEVFADNLMKRISGSDTKTTDPVAQLQRILDMKESFVLLAQKAQDNSAEVYDTIIDSISTAIEEHAQILIEHAEEVVSNLK